MSDALTADLLDELAARWRAIDAPIAHSPTSPVGYTEVDGDSVATPVTDSIGSLVRHWIEVIDIGAVHWIPEPPTDG